MFFLVKLFIRDLYLSMSISLTFNTLESSLYILLAGISALLLSFNRPFCCFFVVFDFFSSFLTRSYTKTNKKNNVK